MSKNLGWFCVVVGVLSTLVSVAMLLQGSGFVRGVFIGIGLTGFGLFLLRRETRLRDLRDIQEIQLHEQRDLQEWARENPEEAKKWLDNTGGRYDN